MKNIVRKLLENYNDNLREEYENILDVLNNFSVDKIDKTLFFLKKYDVITPIKNTGNSPLTGEELITHIESGNKDLLKIILTTIIGKQFNHIKPLIVRHNNSNLKIPKNSFIPIKIDSDVYYVYTTKDILIPITSLSNIYIKVFLTINGEEILLNFENVPFNYENVDDFYIGYFRNNNADVPLLWDVNNNFNSNIIKYDTTSLISFFQEINIKDYIQQANNIVNTTPSLSTDLNDEDITLTEKDYGLLLNDNKVTTYIDKNKHYLINKEIVSDSEVLLDCFVKYNDEYNGYILTQFEFKDFEDVLEKITSNLPLKYITDGRVYDIDSLESIIHYDNSNNVYGDVNVYDEVSRSWVYNINNKKELEEQKLLIGKNAKELRDLDLTLEYNSELIDKGLNSGDNIYYIGNNKYMAYVEDILYVNKGRYSETIKNYNKSITFNITQEDYIISSGNTIITTNNSNILVGDKIVINEISDDNIISSVEKFIGEVDNNTITILDYELVTSVNPVESYENYSLVISKVKLYYICYEGLLDGNITYNEDISDKNIALIYNRISKKLYKTNIGENNKYRIKEVINKSEDLLLNTSLEFPNNTQNFNVISKNDDNVKIDKDLNKFSFKLFSNNGTSLFVDKHQSDTFSSGDSIYVLSPDLDDLTSIEAGTPIWKTELSSINTVNSEENYNLVSSKNEEEDGITTITDNYIKVLNYLDYESGEMLYLTIIDGSSNILLDDYVLVLIRNSLGIQITDNIGGEIYEFLDNTNYNIKITHVKNADLDDKNYHVSHLTIDTELSETYNDNLGDNVKKEFKVDGYFNFKENNGKYEKPFKYNFEGVYETIELIQNVADKTHLFPFEFGKIEVNQQSAITVDDNTSYNLNTPVSFYGNILPPEIEENRIYYISVSSNNGIRIKDLLIYNPSYPSLVISEGLGYDFNIKKITNDVVSSLQISGDYDYKVNDLISFKGSNLPVEISEGISYYVLSNYDKYICVSENPTNYGSVATDVKSLTSGTYYFDVTIDGIIPSPLNDHLFHTKKMGRYDNFIVSIDLSDDDYIFNEKEASHIYSKDKFTITDNIVNNYFGLINGNDYIINTLILKPIKSDFISSFECNEEFYYKWNDKYYLIVNIEQYMIKDYGKEDFDVIQISSLFRQTSSEYIYYLNGGFYVYKHFIYDIDGTSYHRLLPLNKRITEPFKLYNDDYYELSNNVDNVEYEHTNFKEAICTNKGKSLIDDDIYIKYKDIVFKQFSVGDSNKNVFSVYDLGYITTDSETNDIIITFETTKTNKIDDDGNTEIGLFLEDNTDITFYRTTSKTEFNILSVDDVFNVIDVNDDNFTFDIKRGDLVLKVNKVDYTIIDEDIKIRIQNDEEFIGEKPITIFSINENHNYKYFKNDGDGKYQLVMEDVDTVNEAELYQLKKYKFGDR